MKFVKKIFKSLGGTKKKKKIKCEVQHLRKIREFGRNPKPSPTLIAYKNNEEFLILNRDRGAVLISGNKKIKFQIEDSKQTKSHLIFFLDKFEDLIFMKNKFWINVNNHGIYSKTIDELPPELIYPSNWSYRTGKSLKSILENRCLLLVNQTYLTCIPINHENSTIGKVKKIEESGNNIYVDFTVFSNKIFLINENCLNVIQVEYLFWEIEN